MTNFKKLFEQSSRFPRAIDSKGRHIFIADKFPVSNKDTLVISIESTNSKYVQGVGIDTYGYCKVLGKTYRKGKHVNMLFWEDSTILDPKHFEIQVFTKDPHVFIQNIWEAESEPPYVLKKGEKQTCYAGAAFYNSERWEGAAMYSEEIERGRRYFCSDGDGNDSFDNIIFTVQRLKSS